MGYGNSLFETAPLGEKAVILNFLFSEKKTVILVLEKTLEAYLDEKHFVFKTFTSSERCIASRTIHVGIEKEIDKDIATLFLVKSSNEKFICPLYENGIIFDVPITSIKNITPQY